MGAHSDSLVAEGLSFRYGDTSPWIVQDFNHTFDAGEVTLLTGRSGSGKSTLLYVLGSLLRPTSGSLRHGSTDIARLRDGERSAWRAHRSGFVFQDAVLDPSRTVLDNILEPCAYGGASRGAAIERAHSLMQRFGVSLRADARPSQISGGQAQRVALCRALIKEPVVVFADEPTGNLDAETAEIVWSALYALAEDGATVIIATHQPIGRAGTAVVPL